MSETCTPHHDNAANALTTFLCVGLVISYLPQHLRIILAKSSEGFSPWFLLLGSTSSASGMLNIIVMQWGLIRCCRVFSVGNCVESTAGVFQLFLQWFLFTVILVLYMIYYPPHLKYTQIDIDMHDDHQPHHVKTAVKSEEWRLSIILSWVVLIHMIFITFVTFVLIGTNASSDPTHKSRQLSSWATFLGVTAALLAAVQYAPQLAHTYRTKLVGALSIPMMLMQSPGAVLMVLSIALRPGTNWTTWLPYAVAGAMQGSLLVMCILWKFRQHRLCIDDFGNPLEATAIESLEDSAVSVVQGPEEGVPTQAALEHAVETDMRMEGEPNEDTPLLRKGVMEEDWKGLRMWFSRLKR